MSRSYNPSAALPPHWFGLFPGRSPLLGESFIYFLFLEVLRCFSSLGWRQSWIGRAEALGCPIRISPDQWSFAPTRGLSQLITSFIAWMSQGIRRSPFPTFDNTTYSGRHCTAASYRTEVRSYFQLYCLLFFKSCETLNLQFCLCQYVKDPFNAQCIMHNA